MKIFYRLVVAVEYILFFYLYPVTLTRK